MRFFPVLSIALLAILAAPAHAKLRVFACEPEWQALAQEIGGDFVNVYVATGPHQDPHHVDARPSLIAQVRKADIVVCTGASLEVGWLPVLLDRAANPALKGERLFMAAGKVPLLGSTGGPVDRSKGDIHAEGNPHIHLDPRRVMQVGDALAVTLGNLDAGNAANYRQRAAAFRAKLEKAMAGWNLTALRGRQYLVYHDAWPYLVDWLGLKQAGAVEPLPGVPPSSQHLAKLAALAKSQRIDGTLHTGYDERQPVNWLARNAGICAIELPYTVGASAQARDLVTLYGDIVDRLARGCAGDTR